MLLREGAFTTLPTPPDAAPGPGATAHLGLNNHHDISGSYLDAAGDRHGFLLRRGRFTTIDVPAAALTTGRGLNDRRQVVGQYVDSGATSDAEGVLPAGAVHGYVWHDGDVTTVDVPGAALTLPLGITNRGQIVGAYLDAVPGADPYAYWAGRVRGFVLTGRKLTTVDFPGSEGTTVSGINDLGQMVGYYDIDGTRRGFLLDRGRFTRIDPPGLLFTVPGGINDHGQIVGGYLEANGVDGRGFVRDEEGDFRIISAPGDRSDTVAVDNNDDADVLVPADGSVYRRPPSWWFKRSPIPILNPWASSTLNLSTPSVGN